MADVLPVPGLRDLTLLRRHESFDECAGFSALLNCPVEVTLSHAGALTPALVRRLRAVTEVHHEGLQRAIVAEALPDGRWAVLFEPSGGPALSQVLATQGPLLPNDAVQLTLELARSLQAVHAAGLVHGNLAPEHVWLLGGAPAHRPRLGGLALATLDPPSPFQAPEVALGAPPSIASDVFSLAALLVAALTGQPPSPTVVLPPTLEYLRDLLVRCLDADPARRPASLETIVQGLSGIAGTRVSGGPTEAIPLRTPLPSRLGPWELEGLIGQGAMGQVFRARHALLGRTAAIKLLRENQYRRGDLISRFFQEARTVNQINHEHIVEISDFAQEDGPSGPTAVYCVMELLQGESLTERLARGPVPLARGLHIVRQVCQALAAAHRVGVVHRDVKMDNIFLIDRHGDPDYVKVLDFGVAKLTQSLDEAPLVATLDGAIIGTPITMAPEQASGSSVDHRADIYAVGVISYLLLSGRLPFNAENFAKLVVQLMTQPPPPLPASNPLGEPLPEALREVVMACLAKNREARPQSMEALETALASALVPAPKGRQRLLWAATASAVLVAAVLLGLGVFGPSGPTAPPPPVDQPAHLLQGPPTPALLGPHPTPATGAPNTSEPTALPTGPVAATDVPRPPPKPVPLTPQLINQVIKRQGAGVFGCLERFSTLLPSASGAIEVLATIEKTGAVVNARVQTAPVTGTPLATCLTREVQALKFPRNTGPARPVRLPFTYRRE